MHIKLLQTWGIVVYDKSMSWQFFSLIILLINHHSQELVEKESLGPHLSSNKANVHTVKDDAESLHLVLCFHMGIVQRGVHQDICAHIISFVKKKDKSPLPRIMHCPEILNLQLCLLDFQTFFHMSP